MAKNAAQGDDASTAEAATRKVKRGEQGEARRANGTPTSDPQLELEGLRPKPWSKTELRRLVNIFVYVLIMEIYATVETARGNKMEIHLPFRRE